MARHGFASLIAVIAAISVMAGPISYAQAPKPKAPAPKSPAMGSGKPAKTESLKLTPQLVVDYAVSRGRNARGAELEAQRSYVVLQTALGEFDFQFIFTPYYQYSEAETLNSLSQRTWYTAASLGKKFRSGTTASIDYLNTQNHSVWPVSSAELPDASLNSLGLTLRQSLWRNAFGYADRLRVEIGETTVESALENREERLEDILLQSISLYWFAYTAGQQLEENLAARNKYEELVKNVRRKAGYNLSSPGELPRLEAEFEGAEQKVKASSAQYLNALRDLLTNIQLEPTGEVEISAPLELPPVPQLKVVNFESLRAVRVAQVASANADRNLSAVRSQSSSRFDLVAKGFTTGVDESNGVSQAEMQAGQKPTYYVGVEFQTAIDSDLWRGQITDAEVAKLQAENNFAIQREASRDLLTATERNVVSQYAVAKSAIETVGFREKVVRELEVAYRQGRQPMVELIRGYNELFAARLEKARAIGQYHINLNQLAAARDELVVNKKQ